MQQGIGLSLKRYAKDKLTTISDKDQKQDFKDTWNDWIDGLVNDLNAAIL